MHVPNIVTCVLCIASLVSSMRGTYLIWRSVDVAILFCSLEIGSDGIVNWTVQQRRRRGVENVSLNYYRLEGRK
jgi:hypothetical protein